MTIRQMVSISIPMVHGYHSQIDRKMQLDHRLHEIERPLLVQTDLTKPLLVDRHIQHLIDEYFSIKKKLKTIGPDQRKKLLSQTGNGALQLPLGKHINSDAPINEFPFAQDNWTRMLIFVSFVFIVNPRRIGIFGQLMACKISLYQQKKNF